MEDIYEYIIHSMVITYEHKIEVETITRNLCINLTNAYYATCHHCDVLKEQKELIENIQNNLLRYGEIAIEEGEMISKELKKEMEPIYEEYIQEIQELEPNNELINKIEKSIKVCHELFNMTTTRILLNNKEEAKECIETWKKYKEFREKGGNDQIEDIKELIQITENRIIEKLQEQKGFRTIEYLEKTIEINKILKQIIDGNGVNMIKVEELIQEIEGVEEMIGKEYEFRNEYKGNRKGNGLNSIEEQINTKRIHNLLERAKQFPNDQRITNISKEIETTREYYEVLTQYYELINDVQTFTIKLRDFNDIDKEIEEQKNVLENLCLEMKTIEK